MIAHQSETGTPTFLQSSSSELEARLNELPPSLAQTVFTGARKGLWNLSLETEFKYSGCQTKLMLISKDGEKIQLSRVENDGTHLFDIRVK